MIKTVLKKEKSVVKIIKRNPLFIPEEKERENEKLIRRKFHFCIQCKKILEVTVWRQDIWKD